MARHKSTQPTDVELLILQAIWDLGPCGVGDIHQRLQKEKVTKYSTTVKMLAVMREKGLIKRNEKVTPHVYRSTISREKAQKGILKDVIHRIYDGSAGSLVMQALSTKKPTPNEIEEIENLIARMKNEDRK